MPQTLDASQYNSRVKAQNTMRASKANRHRKSNEKKSQKFCLRWKWWGGRYMRYMGVRVSKKVGFFFVIRQSFTSPSFFPNFCRCLPTISIQLFFKSFIQYFVSTLSLSLLFFLVSLETTRSQPPAHFSLIPKHQKSKHSYECQRSHMVGPPI